MARPLISVEAIYDEALRVLDAEGADGLKARNLALRDTLLSRPELARLMKREDRNVVVGYVNRLLRVLFAHGFEHELAVRSCRVLAHATFSLTAADLHSPAGHDDPEVFDTTVAWLIRGIETMVSLAGASCRPADRVPFLTPCALLQCHTAAASLKNEVFASCI